MIPIGCPTVGDLEIARVVETLRAGRLTQGVLVEQFEQKFAQTIHSKYAVACSSGTAALHLSLVALEIHPGEEVLVPDLTYVAVANAVSYLGAVPVLVDVDPESWNIDLQDAERKITPRTVAMIAVHLYGVPCDLDQLVDFAGRHSLMLIEDAAEALGGFSEKSHCGTRGICGTFSFYANKIITTGEGGMVVTDSEDIDRQLRQLRGQGVNREKGNYYHECLGFNYRLTELQAALGLSQLDQLPLFISLRQKVINAYRRELKDIVTSPVREGTAPWLFTGILPIGIPITVAKLLVQAGIETRPIFTPLHQLPMYHSDQDFLVSTDIYSRGLSFPTYPSLSLSDVKYISDETRRIVMEHWVEYPNQARFFEQRP